MASSPRPASSSSSSPYSGTPKFQAVLRELESTLEVSSSIASLEPPKERERRSTLGSLKDRLFPSLEAKLSKVMQEKDPLPGLKKLRKKIKNAAEVRAFYAFLLPHILKDPRILYEVGVHRDVDILVLLFRDSIDSSLENGNRVEFFIQLEDLETTYGSLLFLAPLLSEYMNAHEAFELFEDASFLHIFQRIGSTLNSDVLLRLIAYLKTQGKMLKTFEHLTLTEVTKKDVLFRSTNLLSALSAGYGTHIFSPVLLNLQTKLHQLLAEINVSDCQPIPRDLHRLTSQAALKDRHRASMEIERTLEGLEFGDQKSRGMEEKNRRFLVLVQGVIKELFSSRVPEEGAALLMQRKEILERREFDQSEINIYLGEWFFLRNVNPYLFNMEVGEKRPVMLQLAKVLQATANHATYGEKQDLAWMNPHLTDFSAQFDQFIANLGKPKEEFL